MCRHIAVCPTAGPGCMWADHCQVTRDDNYVGPVRGAFLFQETNERYNAMNEERYGYTSSYPGGEWQRQINVDAQFPSR